MRTKSILLATLLTISTSTVFASDFYVLGSLGRANTNVDKANLDAQLTSARATGLSSSTDESDIGYKLQLGYNINKNFAVEGGYLEVAQFD